MSDSGVNDSEPLSRLGLVQGFQSIKNRFEAIFRQFVIFKQLLPLR